MGKWLVIMSHGCKCFSSLSQVHFQVDLSVMACHSPAIYQLYSSCLYLLLSNRGKKRPNHMTNAKQVLVLILIISNFPPLSVVLSTKPNCAYGNPQVTNTVFHFTLEELRSKTMKDGLSEALATQTILEHHQLLNIPMKITIELRRVY